MDVELGLVAPVVAVAWVGCRGVGWSPWRGLVAVAWVGHRVEALNRETAVASRVYILAKSRWAWPRKSEGGRGD